ncbi:protein-glutamine glutaminase family protein [Streptomyces albogriseolus]|uniref:protein-glutamine glutaminase family protein n=1 Tax=Streptomyces albogriseolus TaxID=1887 RepID=UPI0036955A75
MAAIYLKTVDEPPAGLTAEEALRALARIAPQRLTEEGMTEALRHRLLHAVHERIRREDARRELPAAEPDSPAQHEDGMDDFLLTDVRSVLVRTAGAEFSRHFTDPELDAAVRVDDHYPGATIEHVSPSVDGVLDQLMRERPSGPQERPAALPGSSGRQPDTGHEPPASEIALATEATVDTVPGARRDPVYPTVDPVIRVRWADRFTEAKELLGSLPKETRERLLEQAARFMGGRHQAPPIIPAEVAPGSAEAEYMALFEDMAALIAAQRHTDPRLELPLEEQPAWLLSEELRAAFGTRAVKGLPGGMHSTSRHGPVGSSRSVGERTDRHAAASSSRQGQQSSASASSEAAAFSYGKMGPEFETEWIIDRDLWHGDRLAQLGAVTLTAERLRSEAPTTLEIVGAPIAFRGEADGVSEDDIWRSLDTVMRSLRPGPAIKHLFKGRSGFRALEYGSAGLVEVAPGREFSLSPQWTVGMPASELLDFIMDDVKALSVKSADTAHADAEAGAAFAKETAALFYSATRRTTISNPWLAWETLDDADYRSVAGLLLLVFLQAITPAHMEDEKSAGKEGEKWFKSYTFIASRHDPRTLADALEPHARDFLNKNYSSILHSFSQHARSALSSRYSGDPLDASLEYIGLTARDYLNNFLRRNPKHFVPQKVMRIATIFGELDGGKPLVELRNLADVEGVAQAREQYEDLKQRTHVRYEAAARRAGLDPGHHGRLHALQADLAGSEIAGSLERLLRITGELNLVHHQRALGFELLERPAVKALVRSLLRLHDPAGSSAEQGNPYAAAALRKLDAELVEFAYTLHLFDHAGRSWNRVRGKWAQAMQDTATLRQALSQESVNWPPSEAMHNWKELSALPGMRPRTNLKDIDSAVRTALGRPGDTAALQDILFKVTEWRHRHQGSKREGAIEQLERHVLHQLAGKPEHVARPSAPRRTVPTSSRLRPDDTGPLRATGSRAESPRYPAPSPEVLEEWSERIRYAHDYLREEPDADRLRQQAASIVAAHLLAPPTASERHLENARAYEEHYRGVVEVVASLLGRDRARSQPARRAVQVAQDMADAFGSARISSTTVALSGVPRTGLEPPAQERAWRAPAAPTAEESAVAVEVAYAHLIARHLNAPRVDARGLLATLQRRGSTPSLFTPTSLRTVFRQVTGADLVTTVNAAVLQGRLSMDNHHEVLRGLGLVSDFFFADESPQEAVGLRSAHYGSQSPDVVAYVRQVHRAYTSHDPERIVTLLRDLDRDMRKVWAVEAAWQERYGAPLRQSLTAAWPGYADRVGHVLGDADDSPVPMAQAELWYRQLHMVRFEHPERGIVPVTTEYPDEGCYLRAHLWARELLRWGVAPRKAIGASARLTAMSAHARGATVAAPKQVQWRYHVAPVVNVFGAHGAVVPIVLDPTLGLGPLPVHDWARAIGIPAVRGGQDVFEGPLDQVHARLAEQQRQNSGNWQFAERKLPVRPMLLLTDGHAFRFPYPDEPPPASWQETDALVQQEEDTLFLHHFRAVRRNLARRLQGLFQQVTDAHTGEQLLEALKAEVARHLPQEELLQGFLQGYPEVEVAARRLLSESDYDEFEALFPPPEDSEEHPDYSSEEEMEPGDEMFLDEDEDEDEDEEQEEPGPARRSPARVRGWEPPASWTAPPLAASSTDAEAHGSPDRTPGAEQVSWADLRRRAEPAVIATEVFDPLRSGPYEPGRLPGAMSEVLLDARRFQTASGEWVSDATVRVHLAPHGVSADDTRFLAERMTAAVRRLINEPRFRLPDGSVFHFNVEFLARPETAHHVMAVHAEPGVTTTADVYLVDESGTPLTEYQFVHEFLHFLGLSDRYFAPGYVFRDRPWSGRVALDGSLTAGAPVEGLPVLSAEDLAAVGRVFSSGPVIRDLAYPSDGQAEDTSAPGSPDRTGYAVPSPGARQDAVALIEEFDAGIRPALRVWEDPVADEFDRLTDEVLTDWGSRSLVFGLHEGPLWVINMEGAFRILTEDGRPVSLPETADGPVVSLDIGTDGRLVGPAAKLHGGDADVPLDAKRGFCDVNLGADLSRVLGRRPPTARR